MAWVRPLVAAGCCLGDPLSQAYLLDIESLLAFFERQGLACLVNADRTEIAVPNPDREGWALRILPRDGRGLITFAYPLPGAIPEDRVTALVSAANQLNARTLIGAWVLNTSARELIFRLIYEHARCRKPVQRLWISSLTDEAIGEGFRDTRYQQAQAHPESKRQQESLRDDRRDDAKLENQQQVFTHRMSCRRLRWCHRRRD